MQCPKCQTALRERERETALKDVVVMDVCPSCGGIWLDKGELEKLTESASRYDERRGRDKDDDDGDDDGDHGGRGRQGGRRRGGFFGNLFDFD